MVVVGSLRFGVVVVASLGFGVVVVGSLRFWVVESLGFEVVVVVGGVPLSMLEAFFDVVERLCSYRDPEHSLQEITKLISTLV